MSKHALKILRCEQRRIFQAYLTIFQNYPWKLLSQSSHRIKTSVLIRWFQYNGNIGYKWIYQLLTHFKDGEIILIH